MKTNVEQIEEIFSLARRINSPAERAEYLAAACQDDSELRQQVDSLLLAHEQSGDFPAKTIRLSEPQFIVERTGAMIGRYKLLQKIGGGGFGTVFMAEQIEPVHRKVALKIIKAGMDTREVVARFEAERQALALMDHPNIARVLDAGATEAGRPYFVMELVNGIPITEYCDRERLSISERLQLFMKVCHAVQHAHHKGIIHRDLKPNNVLVAWHDGEPVPKVIDFGVAKALGQKLTDKTIFTAFPHLIGTPAYMSPEQADLSGLDIDTRADIYSLGVLLYELLTSETPFDTATWRAEALDEIRRIIRETEPPKPSARLQTLGDNLDAIARQRHTEPTTLRRLIRGDLDWIVMKSLEKDRKRRYETPDAFASDVARHLNNEPVLAGAPNPLYRVKKTVRRNRIAVSAVGAIVLALAIGLSLSLIALRETRRGREQVKNLLDALDPGGEMRQYAEERKQMDAEDHRLKLETVCELTNEDLTWNAQLSPVEDLFAVVSEKGAIFIYDMRGSLLRELHHPTEACTCVAYSPDGRRLLAGTRSGKILLWNLAGTNAAVVFNHTGTRVARVAWLPNPDRGVFFVDASTTENTPYLKQKQENPSAFIFNITNGDLLLTIYSLATSYNQPFATATGGKRLAILDLVGKEPGGFLIDTVSGNPDAAFYNDKSQTGPLCISLAPDNHTVAIGYAPQDVSLWNGSTGQQIRSIKAHSNWVVALAFSPDSNKLISGAGDSSASIWEVATGAELGRIRFAGESTFVRSVAFSHDGRLVLAAAEWHDGRNRTAGARILISKTPKAKPAGLKGAP